MYKFYSYGNDFSKFWFTLGAQNQILKSSL